MSETNFEYSTGQNRTQIRAQKQETATVGLMKNTYKIVVVRRGPKFAFRKPRIRKIFRVFHIATDLVVKLSRFLQLLFTSLNVVGYLHQF